ncbi:R-phycoerythrin gamma chain, chloroplastic [Gracilariopsis chorda]|uniref:R-phycoerythrin gamma chain, chloroplastic n=1 Tax=Gracilariopsis chorda TaxID=448386 RepID=A0A2V3IVR4_9FLOR|nr:R-phycoerythrin gamma chain, chloroplastic [Gracilariopsis chorda]|eukprot:PXF46179.1 R-phycoerythrin gamma chain, chloroplastic [Gracilariopsis chorda]
MDSAAFAVNGMFSAVNVGTSSFTKNNVTSQRTTASPAAVRMAVDPFQKQFQSPGKINVDYSRPKKLATYKRSGYSAILDYPTQPSMAGHYSISNCNITSGAKKILMKYDEYCAKGMMQVYKRSAVPYGEYTTKCTEGTLPQQAFDKRVFNRTQAFRQAQKPINVRLGEQYENRRLAFIFTNGCHREEQQFKEMPMSTATYLAGRSEALGTCYRLVTPTTVAEDYMADSVRSQITQKAHPTGVYRVGVCEDGYAKGDAENRRVAALASEFRTSQQSASAITGQQYESARTARKLYASSCHHEETQIYQYPAVAAAMCRD